MPPSSLVFPEDLPGIRVVMERGINEGVRVSAVGRTRKKDGTFLWMEVTGRLACDPVTGEIIETVVVMRDIHQRKLQEEQLSILARTDG
ncbi:MAG: PAS domain-containing protein [Acidobacteriota bacterium]|nr:PAS domain-containing protein [Acidobacteriota bacterium]